MAALYKKIQNGRQNAENYSNLFERRSRPDGRDLGVGICLRT